MAELKVGIRIDSLRRPLRQALQEAAQMGVAGVELNARTEIHPSQLSDTGVRQLRKMLDDLNLRVISMRYPTRRGYDHPQDLDRRVDGTKAAMTFAYRLGCPVVINQIGRVPESDEDPGFSALQSIMNDLGRHGARVGAFLAAETGTEPGERLGAVLDGCEDGFVAVALNPGQLIIHRHSVPEAVMALKNRIQMVCAVDGVLDLAAGRGLSVPLGQGTADFAEIIGMLEDTQYRGGFVVGRAESTADELRQGVEYLQHL